MIFVDGHVHMYDCFDVDLFFDSALKNFQEAARQNSGSGLSSNYVLLLTMGKNEKWFQKLCAQLKQDASADKKISSKWHGLYSDESSSVTVSRADSPGEKIHLVPGHQIVTREKIEVLALFCLTEIQDGLMLNETVETIRKLESIPVLPWGVGKWFGNRGKIILNFLRDNAHDVIFVGDNGGRPKIWPTPKLFRVARKKGLEVLPGTDPLPLPGEASRVGSFGFYLQENVPDGDSPVTLLKNVLLSSNRPIVPYGSLQNNIDFLLNQFRLKFSSCS